MTDSRDDQGTRDMEPISVGDRITFRARTVYASRKATRLVTGTDPITVNRFHGWKNFQVRDGEVLEVHSMTPATKPQTGTQA